MWQPVALRWVRATLNFVFASIGTNEFDFMLTAREFIERSHVHETHVNE